MSLPTWIRRLPHNLSTIRPSIRLHVDRYQYGLGLLVYFDAAVGDSKYPFHFDEVGVTLVLGPFEIFVGLIDTPERRGYHE